MLAIILQNIFWRWFYKWNVPGSYNIVFWIFFVITSFFVGITQASELYAENLASSIEASTSKQPITLSLNEAILLAVRSNPNVQSVQLALILQKFNVHVQRWQFDPHYGFQTSATFSRAASGGQTVTGAHNYAMQPSVSIETPVGSQITLTSTNVQTGHYNPGLSAGIVQPLLRGFGKAIVESALNNALDSEVISRLNIEGALRNTVTAVINGYLDVIMAEQTITIDNDAVKRAELSVKQTKLFIKAGHKAGNELITVRANVATAKTQLENDKNNLNQARYALLAAIGIDPNTEVLFSNLNVAQLIKKYHLPTMETAKEAILRNDIQYQIDQITLHGSTTRALLIAQDNTRWQLSLTANVATGTGAGGGQNSGMNSLFNGANQSQNVGLTLQIPIDDQIAKQVVLNAKIALKQAELSLLQEKWTKETSAINGWHSIGSTERAFQFAEDAERLQEKTYDLSYKKYLHGLIDSLELQSAQIQLIHTQQTLLNAKVSYLKSLVNLDLLMGNTLTTWNVTVRL